VLELVGRSLGGGGGLLVISLGLGSSSLGATGGDTVVLFRVLLEGGSVDLDDSSLDKSVGGDQFVGSGVVAAAE